MRAISTRRLAQGPEQRRRAAASTSVACVLLTIVFPACVFAQADHSAIREGFWNDSLPSALSVARYTGRPVLVFFVEDWCGYCEELEKVLVHPDSPSREALKRFILVKLKLSENEIVGRQYQVREHHQVVMLDWAGKTVGKASLPSGGQLAGGKSARDVALKVSEAATTSDLVAGDKLLELGYYAKAAERYAIVTKLSRDEKTLKSAKKGLADIREKSARQIELIRSLIRSGRLDDAASACTEFISDFPPDMGKAEAERLLTMIRSGKPITLPDAKGVVEPEPAKVTPQDAAKRLLDQGMVHEWDKRLFDAVGCYQDAVKLYPETPAAKEAGQRMRLLLADRETRDLIARQKMDRYCTRWLEMGDVYEKNGRDDMAIKYYNTVVSFYPDSDYAVEAQRRLIEIERRHLKELEKK